MSTTGSRRSSGVVRNTRSRLGDGGSASGTKRIRICRLSSSALVVNLNVLDLPRCFVALRTWSRSRAAGAMSLSFIEHVNSEMPEVDEPLIIESAEVWDRAIRTRGHMTLIPMFERPDVATAIQRGHHVVLVAGGDEHVRGEKIELGRLHRHDASEALRDAGVDFETAHLLAGLQHGAACPHLCGHSPGTSDLRHHPGRSRAGLPSLPRRCSPVRGRPPSPTGL